MTRVPEVTMKKVKSLGLDLLASNQYELIGNVMYEVKYLTKQEV